MRTSVVLLVFALVSATSCFGQSSSASPAVDYSAEPIVVEKLETVYRFSADGTGTREMTTVARIQSDAAARQYGVLNFPFAGNSEHVEFAYIRVRKADGSIVETPASDAQEMPPGAPYMTRLYRGMCGILAAAGRSEAEGEATESPLQTPQIPQPDINNA